MKFRLLPELTTRSTRSPVLQFRLCFIIILIFCTIPFRLSAEVFDFNFQCQRAYKEIIQLKLKAGQSLLDEEKRIHPDNLIPYFLENYIDFFVLFFNEDPVEYKTRLGHLDQRLKLMGKGSTQSPYFLFTKSVMHFQWATVRIKFGYNWDAGWQFRRAYLQMKENMQLFPSFTPNHIYNGAMQVAVGTIPDGYKWLSNLLGLKGSIRAGMDSLRIFLESNSYFSRLFFDEASFYFLYLKFYMENDKDGVFDYIKKEKLDVRNNHLLAYLAVNLSINNQRSDEARRILAERNMSSDYLSTCAWDLEMGYIAINRLEPDAAKYFEKFIQNFRGKFYVKDALQKLSWYYYLQGNQAQANFYRSEISSKGGLFTEADQQALKEAEAGRWPNKLLLQARLLNDGGYYSDALRLLQGKRIADFTSIEDRLEFAYRVARIYDDTNRDEEAIEFYKKAISLGEHRKEYYAARGALQIGYIYERRSNRQAAISWFERCIKMKDHDYKNSLDQRAKAGIERCKENMKK
jgi:tetratricopeptide (TPR) repeat protein